LETEEVVVPEDDVEGEVELEEVDEVPPEGLPKPGMTPVLYSANAAPPPPTTTENVPQDQKYT
jgi:hypothetical protein